MSKLPKARTRRIVVVFLTTLLGVGSGWTTNHHHNHHHHPNPSRINEASSLTSSCLLSIRCGRTSRRLTSSCSSSALAAAAAAAVGTTTNHNNNGNNNNSNNNNSNNNNSNNNNNGQDEKNSNEDIPEDQGAADDGNGGEEDRDDSSSSSSSSSSLSLSSSTNNSNNGIGEYDPGEEIRKKNPPNVGDPQRLERKVVSVTSILKELQAIQQQGTKKYCILGTRHCSFLHQQIIELLAYALVLGDNHVYTSGAGGTHMAAVRGALRAEKPSMLTVVLPQSMERQPMESQELLNNVTDVVSMPQNDDMSLDAASRICNSYLLSRTDQLISFAFHASSTVLEAAKEAKELNMLVTLLYLD